MNNLPPGLQPTSDVNDSEAILYLGGAWNIRADAIGSLKIPPRFNYAGENPYPDLSIIAVTQEIDGNQAVSDAWIINFDIYPVVDGASSWNPEDLVSEQANEEGGPGVSLDVITDFNRIDGVNVSENLPEIAVTVEYNLTTLIDDAQIRARLNNLLNSTDAGIQDLIDKYLIGDYTSFNSVTGILVATRAQVAAGLFLSAELFFQSNLDFNIPVRLFIEDRATINGTSIVDPANYTGTLKVDLVGTADPPTVFADNASGFSLTRISVNLGGAITDADIELNRTSSETLYFIVTEIKETNMSFDYIVSPCTPDAFLVILLSHTLTPI